MLNTNEKDDEELRRKLSKHFINYVVVYPNKIVVSLCGFFSTLHNLNDVPDFESVDKCLILQDQRRTREKLRVWFTKIQVFTNTLNHKSRLFGFSKKSIMFIIK